VSSNGTFLMIIHDPRIRSFPVRLVSMLHVTGKLPLR
jgi:hypothetical protein